MSSTHVLDVTSVKRGRFQVIEQTDLSKTPEAWHCV